MSNFATLYQVSSETFVLKYTPLVKRIAHHLLGRLPPSVLVDDLVQAGMIGLLEAKNNYRSDKGASFETFAGIRIRGAMLDEIRRGDWVPRSVHKNHRTILTATQFLEAKLRRAPTDQEMAEYLNLSLSAYFQQLHEIDLGYLVGLADLGVAEDTLSCNNLYDQRTPQTEMEHRRFQQALIEAIRSLPEREGLVLSLYYDEELNLKEIGLILEVSESRVSQIHSQAMQRLRVKLDLWAR